MPLHECQSRETALFLAVSLACDAYSVHDVHVSVLHNLLNLTQTRFA
jgi:hypothetical protein